LVNAALLVAIGCDVAASTDRVELTTGSGVDYAARLDVDAIRALGVKRRHFQVLAHTLPPTAGVDGLLGVDFFFDRVLTIDFQHNTLEVL
jgi:hypothetical protein